MFCLAGSVTVFQALWRIEVLQVCLLFKLGVKMTWWHFQKPQKPFAAEATHIDSNDFFPEQISSPFNKLPTSFNINSADSCQNGKYNSEGSLCISNFIGRLINCTSVGFKLALSWMCVVCYDI